MNNYTHHTLNYRVEQISDTVGILRTWDNTTIGQVPIDIIEGSNDWNLDNEPSYSEDIIKIIKSFSNEK